MTRDIPLTHDPVQLTTQVPHEGPSSESLEVKELTDSEFALADAAWKDYHETCGNPATDRIFGVFVNGSLVSLARCRRHGSSLEVDGIWTPPLHREHGYSRMAVGALVEACHNDDLYMYAVSHLTGFYARFGFLPIPEKDLPEPIRERYTWAAGNLEGAEVQPMVRKQGAGAIFVRQ